MVTVNNAVAVITKSLEVFKTAPEILKANQERTSKALIVGNNILDQWQSAWNIEDQEERVKALAAADERSNKFLANCSTALGQEKEARAAITQLMDEFRKMFTAAENDLDRSKPNTVPSKVQNWRDTYVQECAEIEKHKRQEAEKAAAKSKARIDYKSALTLAISNRLNKHVAEKKMRLNASFNAIPLELFEEKSNALRNLNCFFGENNIDLLLQDIDYSDSRFDPAELHDLKTQVFKEYNFSGFYKTYSDEITEVKQLLIDRLPSKKAELEDIKRQAEEAEKKRQEEIEKARVAEQERQVAIQKAKGEEKERLEAEAKRKQQEEAERLQKMQEEQEAERIRKEEEVKAREKAEAERLAKEAEEKQRQSALEIEMKTQADLTLNLFDQESKLSELTAKPEAREGYEITVNHPAGFVQIFSLWFEHEGKNLPINKLEKTSLGQMKSFCEKLAMKKDIRIEGKMLTYTETFKAVNRKAV
jgi:hypothetical protein